MSPQRTGEALRISAGERIVDLVRERRKPGMTASNNHDMGG
jgi:hypothetical protein